MFDCTKWVISVSFSYFCYVWQAREQWFTSSFNLKQKALCCLPLWWSGIRMVSLAPCLKWRTRAGFGPRWLSITMLYVAECGTAAKLNTLIFQTWPIQPLATRKFARDPKSALEARGKFTYCVWICALMTGLFSSELCRMSTVKSEPKYW